MEPDADLDRPLLLRKLTASMLVGLDTPCRMKRKHSLYGVRRFSEVNDDYLDDDEEDVSRETPQNIFDENEGCDTPVGIVEEKKQIRMEDQLQEKKQNKKARPIQNAKQDQDEIIDDEEENSAKQQDEKRKKRISRRQSWKDTGALAGVSWRVF